MDLAEQARAAAARWSPRAAERGQSLELRADGAARAFANPADVAAALDNLIENALVYSPAGTRVVVEAASDDGHASVAVSDDGPGIPADELPRVVERFYRGRGASAPGTGLGLAIVHEIATRWGGTLDLASDGGTRTTVRFRAGS